jgi:hypothetical protein
MHFGGGFARRESPAAAACKLGRRRARERARLEPRRAAAAAAAVRWVRRESTRGASARRVGLGLRLTGGSRLLLLLGCYPLPPLLTRRYKAVRCCCVSARVPPTSVS